MGPLTNFSQKKKKKKKNKEGGREVRRAKSALIPNRGILLRVLGRLDQIGLGCRLFNNCWDRGAPGVRKEIWRSRACRLEPLVGFHRCCV